MTSDECGPGTYSDGGVCLPQSRDATLVSCGPGTVLEGTKCVLAEAGGYTSAIDAGTECAIADNIFVIDGNGGAHPGPRRVIQGGVGWTITSKAKVGGVASTIYIEFGSYSIRIDTHKLGKSLAGGLYANFKRYGENQPGEPGFDLGGEGHGCSKLFGDFTIISVTFDALGEVTDILGTYQATCDVNPDLNYGCFHVKPKS